MTTSKCKNHKVVTNLRTGLDLRTDLYCCENTNLRTELDQWTGNQWHVAMGYNKRSTNEPVECPHACLGDSEK